MRFSAGRLILVVLSPVIAAGFVAILLMLLAVVATEMATTIDIPYLVTYTGTKDPTGGGRILVIDGSWAAATALTGILTFPLIALALFLPD
ncbi:hypothetical protein ACFZA2_06805 [Microbacterium sp. NPDC007973]|uniref:hypothetical protein n=1 Tax=Microbacterium sp. NPDC007973 TaxID=3364182 RepID=UPI0036E20353